MITWIVAALALFVVQTLIPPTIRYALGKESHILLALGPRDTPPETTIHGSRSERALKNYIEAIIVFLPLALLLSGSPDADLLGAQLFVFARVLYAMTYIAGVPYLRSALWLTGHAGLGLMLFQLL